MHANTPEVLIRAARESDLRNIKAWLPSDRDIPTLAMNWSSTIERFHKKGIMVCEEKGSGLICGYAWGSLNDDGIMEIHPARRGLGIGATFTKYLMDQCISTGEGLLQIQCSPESSASFWEKMGFTVVDMDNKLVGRQILHIAQELPVGDKIIVRIEFYHERALYGNGEEEKCLAEHQVDGVICPTSGELVLSAKVFGFDPDGSGDLAVKVSVGGEQIYFGKAKHSGAEELGFARCKNGFCVGSIRLSDAI